MFEITHERYEKGLSMAHGFSECLNAIHCLWGREKRDCGIYKSCRLIAFRRVFENDSPALFGLFKRLSEYDAVLHDFTSAEVESEDVPEEKRRAQRRLGDILAFSRISLIAFYPLFLANEEEVPFLSLKEIEILEKRFSDLQLDQISEEIWSANVYWFARIGALLPNLWQKDKYSKAIFRLVWMFLWGIKKNQPPEEFASEPERIGFISEVQDFLSQTRVK